LLFSVAVQGGWLFGKGFGSRFPSVRTRGEMKENEKKRKKRNRYKHPRTKIAFQSNDFRGAGQLWKNNFKEKKDVEDERREGKRT
jgi:hypothetical protein